MKDLKDFFTTGNLRYIVYGFAVVFVALLIFHAGFFLGAQQQVPPGRSVFEWRFQAPGVDIRLPGGALQDGHGAVGVIESVATSSIVLRNRSGNSRTVLLVPDTHIRTVNGEASSSALEVGQMVVVLGTPSGEDSITADLVRFLPSPPSGNTSNQNP